MAAEGRRVYFRRMKSNDTEKGTALVTGASSGIGFQLARQFASHGHDVIIVAPGGEQLENASADLSREYAVPVRAIARDLTDPDAAESLFEEITGDGINVDILANNAGLGQRGKFWE